MDIKMNSVLPYSCFYVYCENAYNCLLITNEKGYLFQKKIDPNLKMKWHLNVQFSTDNSFNQLKLIPECNIADYQMCLLHKLILQCNVEDSVMNKITILLFFLLCLTSSLLLLFAWSHPGAVLTSRKATPFKKYF